MCFLVNFAKFLKKPFCIEHLRWLIHVKEKERGEGSTPSFQKWIQTFF